MKIHTNTHDVYVDQTAVASVSIREDKHWDTKRDQYIVDIVLQSAPCSVPIYTTYSKEDAVELVCKIGEAMDTIEPSKTYLDGFKEGTEYALKLVKENK